jgi:uncharacterized SAM-binding protein YcdF (DUF218 family)
MQKIRKIIIVFLMILGSFSFIITIIAFTSLPYNVRKYLATRDSVFAFNPDYIIMLGGSGMPSEENLIRLYYTAEAAKLFQTAIVIIAHPYDSLVQIKMRKELVIRGIDSTRIFFEENGTNTRSQVLNIMDTFPTTINSKCIVVTSPEQMFRSLKSFRKAGVKIVGGYPAYPCDMYIDLKFNLRKLKGSKYILDVGDNINLRYNFWNYLKLEISCIREFTAIIYYKLNGWI